MLRTPDLHSKNYRTEVYLKNSLEHEEAEPVT
jgi:hypothetical protein